MPGEILLLLLIIHLPFLMPGWRSFLLLLSLCPGVEIGVALGIRFVAADELPREVLRIGNLWQNVLRWCLPVTLLARGIVLAARASGVRLGWRVVLTVLGLLALPGWVVGNLLLEGWKRRPAPAECSERPVPVLLSGLAGKVGWSQGISLYRGPVLRADGRYMHSP